MLERAGLVGPVTAVLREGGLTAAGDFGPGVGGRSTSPSVLSKPGRYAPVQRSHEPVEARVDSWPVNGPHGAPRLPAGIENRE